MYEMFGCLPLLYFDCVGPSDQIKEGIPVETIFTTQRQELTCQARGNLKKKKNFIKKLQ